MLADSGLDLGVPCGAGAGVRQLLAEHFAVDGHLGVDALLIAVHQVLRVQQHSHAHLLTGKIRAGLGASWRGQGDVLRLPCGDRGDGGGDEREL